MGNKHNEIQFIKMIKNQKLENQDAFLQNVESCENSSLKKSPKQWHKKFAVGCLAVLMCSVAFLGVGCANTSGSLSGTANGGSATNSGAGAGLSNNSGGESGNNGGGGVVSPFGLCPETDPVVYTTDSGLDIKFGGATLSSGALSGYTYFTMGSYGGVDVNWVIIGRNSHTYNGSVTSKYSLSLANFLIESAPVSTAQTIQNWVINNYESTTPEGSAIVNDNIANDIVYVDETFSYSLSLILSSKESTNDTIDLELNPGEVLCLSEKNITTSYFNSTAGTAYQDSILQTKMNELFDTGLSFSNAQKAIIIPKHLTNLGYSNTTYTPNAYLFPMAGRGEQFNLSTYLNSDALRISYSLGTTTTYSFWLRSGYANNAAYCVSGEGLIRYQVTYDRDGTYSFGVRPAFVMKLA